MIEWLTEWQRRPSTDRQEYDYWMAIIFWIRSRKCKQKGERDREMELILGKDVKVEKERKEKIRKKKRGKEKGERRRRRRQGGKEGRKERRQEK